MSEIGEICMCKRIMKHQTNTSSGIPFYKIGTFGKKADAYISNELYEEYKKKYSFPRKGEILISASGTIGKAIIYDGAPAYFQDSNIIWISNDEDKVLNKYLYYCYQIAEWKTEGGTIKRLYNANLAKMKIAVPPISEQQRIVCILDKFEALVNDLSQGLPAEIAAVQEQNSQFAAGQFGQQPMSEYLPYTYSVNTKGRLVDEKEFGNIILKSNNDSGAMLRLKDVARIELGAQDYSVTSKFNGEGSVAFAIYLQPGANALETAELVKTKMEELDDLIHLLEGSGLGSVVEDLKTIYPKATFKEAFCIYGHETRKDLSKVDKWLKSLNY